MVIRGRGQAVTVTASADVLRGFAVGVTPADAPTVAEPPVSDQSTPTPTPTAVPTDSPTPTATVTSTATATQMPTATPTPTAGGGPGFGPVVALAALLAGAALALRRR